MHEYDRDYYESGKNSNYYNYSWKPKLIGPRLGKIINTAKVTPPARILDFGCAKGFYVRWLRHHKFDAIGIDSSFYAISQAPKEIAEHIFHGDHKLLSTFQDNEFDLTIAKDVLEHLELHSIEEVLHKLKRVSKCVIVVVPFCDFRGSFVNEEDQKDITHKIRFTEEKWMSLFSGAEKQNKLCSVLKGHKSKGTLCVMM